MDKNPDINSMNRLPHHIDVVAGAPLEAASIVFVSTDSNTTPGALNNYVLRRLGAEYPADSKILNSQGFLIEKLPRGPILVWILIEGRSGGANTQLFLNLQKALPQALKKLKLLEMGNQLWLPLMGTVAGILDNEASAVSIFTAFQDVLSADIYPQLDITVSMDPKTNLNSLESIRQLAKSKMFEKLWVEVRTSSSDYQQEDKKGFGLKFQRETTEELALDRGKFALAIARLFKIANGEFSLALLGRWGSGKTTIANHIIKYLRDQKAYNSDFSEIFNQESETENNTDYEIVEFNALRYRRKPELWIWLYESFVSTFLNCDLGKRVLRSIRAGTEKHGFYTTFAFVILLAITAVPLMWGVLIFPSAIAIFGLVGLVGLFFLARRWQRSLRLLVDRYGMVASHREKLGMQALVGEDLKSLVKSWSRSNQFSLAQKLGFLIVIVAVAIVWGSSFFGVGSGMFFNWLQQLASQVGFDITKASPIKLVFSVSAMAWCIWCIIAGTFVLAIVTDIGRTDRILLVIDDLDRCPQEEIVDLIDGIKLMIDDKEVGKFVQVLVLADDTILEEAIRHRFERKEATNDSYEEATNDSNNEYGNDRWRTAVREHMEKVFLCHISIPVLEVSDLEPLVDVFGGEFGQTGQLQKSTKSYTTKITSTDRLKVEFQDIKDESQIESINNSNSEAVLSIGSEEGITQGKLGSNFETPNTVKLGESDLDAATVLSVSELTAIKSAISKHFSTGENQHVVTPRSIRSLLFKYQLARMILQANTVFFDADQLARPLVQEVFSSNESSRLSQGKDDEITLIVRLVA